MDVLPRWEQVPFSAVTHADVVSWHAELRSKVGAARTRHAVDALSQMLQLAVRDGRLPRNVTQGVRRPRMPRPQQRFLTHQEVARLAEACPAPYDLLVLLLAYTGFRFGEAAGLLVGDVEVSRGRVAVNGSMVEVNGVLIRDVPKTHQRRSVPVPGFLLEQLAEFVEDREPIDSLFSSPRGGPLRNSNFRVRAFDPAVRETGLALLTPHDLRDTAASLAISSGASVKAVQRMLGHASAAMTLDVYAGLFDGELDAVASRLDDAARSEAGALWNELPSRNDSGS